MELKTIIRPIALLFATSFASSCSSDEDIMYNTNNIEDESYIISVKPTFITSENEEFDTIGKNAHAFTIQQLDTTDTLPTSTYIELPLRFVEEEEFYKYYSPDKSRTSLSPYSQSNFFDVILKSKDSSYEATIKCGRMTVKYYTDYAYSFPDTRNPNSCYGVLYSTLPGEYAGDPTARKKNELELAVSVKIYTKISEEYLKYSHSAGFTTRIQNKEFRVVDYFGI